VLCGWQRDGRKVRSRSEPCRIACVEWPARFQAAISGEGACRDQPETVKERASEFENSYSRLNLATQLVNSRTLERYTTV